MSISFVVCPKTLLDIPAFLSFGYLEKIVGDDGLAVYLLENVLQTLAEVQKQSGSLGLRAQMFFTNFNLLIKNKSIEGNVIKSGDRIELIVSSLSKVKYKNQALFGGAKPDLDAVILGKCLELMAQNNNVELVTTNASLEAKASILGIKIAPIRKAIGLDYRGWRRLDVGEQVFQSVLAHARATKHVMPDMLAQIFSANGVEFDLTDLRLHEYVVIESQLGREYVCFQFDGFWLVALNQICLKIEGIACKPRSALQSVMMNAMLAQDSNSASKDPRIVLISSRAGTGKTFCAMATALNQTLRHWFEKIVLVRANVGDDRAMGALPGCEIEKTDWLLNPIYSVLKELYQKELSFGSNSDAVMRRRFLFDKHIELMNLEHLRGVTISKSIVIIEEAQNLDIDQISLVIQRIGEGSMVIVIGDPSQTSRGSKLDEYSNGLTMIATYMHDSPFFYCLRDLPAEENHRSELSRDFTTRVEKIEQATFCSS